MIINTLKSTFIYDGSSELDLINPPNKTINYNLYIDYNNFINSIVAIYGDQRDDGSIPVFWTKISNDTNLTRIANADSTLKSLKPGKTYYIECLNNYVLPLKVPQIGSLPKPPIHSDDVLDPYLHTITIDEAEIVLTDSPHVRITASYDQINTLDNYIYNFFSIDSNWPSRIRHASGIITPEKIYQSNNNIYGSGQIETVFSFFETLEDNNDEWVNLNYTLENYNNENFIKYNIYTLLGVSLTNVTNSGQAFASTVIRCVNCLDEIDNCISGISVNINNTTKIYPPLSINRPGAELTIEQTCCGSDQYIYANISNACCEKVYNYYFSSYPQIFMSPESGQFSYGNGSGIISSLFNLNGETSTVINLKITNPDNNLSATDSMIVRCKPITITVDGQDATSNGYDGNYYLANNYDENNNSYWSKDGCDSYPRIRIPGPSMPLPSSYYWFLSSGISNFDCYITNVQYPYAPASTGWIENTLIFSGNGINSYSDIQ